MSSVVLIISIPTEEQEKCLLKKMKKKVVIDEKPEVLGNSCRKTENRTTDFENNFGFIGSREFVFPAKKEQQSMEQIIRSAVKELDITDLTWTKTEDGNHYQIIFPMECGDKCEAILDIFKENGIGNRLNSKISVMPCTIHYQGKEVNENEEIIEDDYLMNYNKNSGWNLFVSSVRSRLTVAQVVENVKAKAAMTFDFIMLLLISTILCALGLVENNSIYMLSSMLISPMMGPVMAGTFGSIIRDKHLQKNGVQNELIGLGIATVVGFCYGSIICLFTDKYGMEDWPTKEMYSRGELRSLWVGAIIALLSGAAVALGVLSDNIASLVGVAISTSLMPPAVNAGLLWSLGFIYYIKYDEAHRYLLIKHTDYFSTNSAVELTALGAISLCLTFVNIVCIYVAAILVFWIKEVAPQTAKDHLRRRFWQHDIKVTRNHNMTIQLGGSTDMRQSILDQIAATQKIKDLNHFSTDLSKGNLKLNIKRPEFTWSPCLGDGMRRSSVELNLPDPKDCRSYRRLSQIFSPLLRKEDNLEIVPERITERTPLLKSHSVGAQLGDGVGSTYLLSSGKKITVTPCDTP
ncbi:uncharacterized protein [Euwallacea fornicatus]|uniref:uncharacterized protein n=1 Tax=Euwallacea fornicatus TaxID=995702 RepID=UPI00338FD68A